MPTIETEKGKTLTSGQVDLIRRALRYYAHAEQLAIQDARVAAARTRRKKDAVHAEDVARHAGAHVAAADALLEYLAPDFKQDRKEKA